MRFLADVAEERQRTCVSVCLCSGEYQEYPSRVAHASPMWRFVTTLCLVLGLLPLGFIRARPAQAVAVPEWGFSWYFTESASVAYDKGYALGQEAGSTPGTQQYVVVLAFGAMVNTSNGWTFSQWGLPSISDGAAKNRAQQFALGFWVGAGGDLNSFVRVAIGTHNNSGDVTFNAGKAMANRVDEGNAWIVSQGVSSQSGMFGANDLELGFGPPAPARDWVDGFDNNTSTSFYDSGDAAGCSTSGPAGTECGTSSYPGWAAHDVWYVSDYANAVPLPQIYTDSGSMAKQWKWLSVYAFINKVVRMNIRGSATQHGACAQKGGCSGINNTVSDGYNQLYNQLASDGRSYQPAASLLATDWKWTNP